MRYLYLIVFMTLFVGSGYCTEAKKNGDNNITWEQLIRLGKNKEDGDRAVYDAIHNTPQTVNEEKDKSKDKKWDLSDLYTPVFCVSIVFIYLIGR